VGGGWFGYLGYCLGGAVEALAAAPPRPVSMPSFALAFYDHVVVADVDGRWWFEALWTPERAERLSERHALLAERIASSPAPRSVCPGPFHVAAPGPTGHLAAVEAAKARIAAGEFFQTNLCLRLDARIEGSAGALAVRVAEALRPEHGAYLEGPWGAVVSASPELFLRRCGRHVRTEPIKGTAARGADAGQDESAAAALVASEKDRAENVMIVDLMRSDLGRVSRYGSVRVGAVAERLPRGAVWHLVSEVEGELRDDVGDGDLLRATFPPGSVTGAPKIQAMRVIAELESAAREVYTGAIGFCSPVTGLELSVAIRTFEIRGEQVWLGVGGGITACSDAQAELEECYVKAEPLVAAAGTRLLRTAVQRVSGEPPPPALRDARERPDPGAGLLETVRVDCGTPLDLGSHLERLAGSARGVYGACLPDELRDLIAGALAAQPCSARAALRVEVVPVSEGGLRAAVAVTPLATNLEAGDVVLHPFLLPGGLGAHKWLDRRLLHALTQDCGGTPLIVDADGSVLECAWGNVWLVEGDGLVTSDADGRILPGTTRRALLALAGDGGPQISVEPITLGRMRAADGIIATSSLRLAVPAGLGGGASESARRHAALLRESLRAR
jgi:para-aminobenzoate synthetase/4-amino-4-deoxychorismate lyase